MDDAQQVEAAFRTRVLAGEGDVPAATQALSSSSELDVATAPPNTANDTEAAPPRPIGGIDKTDLAFPEPRRIRDKEHLQFVAKQPCLICGRSPSDPHHLRFAQARALGRKASDEFVVPLCRGHHRELHRGGDEAGWWRKSGIDPMPPARLLWLTTHPLRPVPSSAVSVLSADASIDGGGGQLTIVLQNSKMS